MSWSRVDDQFYTHPKVSDIQLPLLPAAIGLWTLALSWCANQLTDGRIPRSQVARLIGSSEAYALADELVRVGLWEKTEQGYLIHDYLTYNPSQEEVLAERERIHQIRSEAGKRGAEVRWSYSKNGNPIANESVAKWQSDGPVPVSRIPEPINPEPKPQKTKPLFNEAEFEEFWSLYPRKQGKGAAKEAWAKARRKAEAEVILAGVRVHLPGWRTKDPQYIPLPTTWLNQERWQDTPPANGASAMSTNTARALALVEKYEQEEATW